MGNHEAEKAEQERQRAEQEYQKAQQEKYKQQQEEEKRKRAEIERKQKEAENKKLEEMRRNNEAAARKLELEIQIERERRKREQEEWEREQEEKRREMEFNLKKERERKEQERKKKNKEDINKFRSEQDIGNFLFLVERFLDDPYFLKELLKALNEEKIITNYNSINDSIEDKTGGKIQIIKQAVSENEFEPELLRKLILILFCNEKNGGNCNKLFEEFLQKKDNKINELIFDILLKYSKNFQNDIKFENAKIYRQFVVYSIKVNKYIESLDYRSNDYIQLKLLNEMKEEIFKSDNIIKIEFGKFEDYTYVYESVNEIIKFEKNLRKKLVILQKAFWENFYIYYINNENEKTKLEKLVDLYELLLSYVDLGKDDTEYKDILAKNIHELVEKKIENTIDVSKQLELLFEVDRYYAHPSDLRDPHIFNSINIFDLTDKKDIEYFQKKKYRKNIRKKL